MKSDIIAIFIFLLTVILIGFLLYTVLHRPRRIQIYNEMPPNTIPTHWWGYGWQPWWRKYAGVPGFGNDKSLPEPKMPVPPKPIVINK